MFDIVEFITNLFKKTNKSDTGLKAKERLKLVLISDRATVSPHIMESLREELLEVISRYMTIDTASVEMGLQRTGNAMALAANIPVISVKRGRKSRGGNGSSSGKRTAVSPVETIVKDPEEEKTDEKPVITYVRQDTTKKEIIEPKDHEEIISISTISESTDDSEQNDDDDSRKKQSRKRVRRYKARVSGGRRSSRKRTRV